MEGDEKLSPQAQLYTKYYGKKWEEANHRYLSVDNDADKAIAQSEMDKYHALADDIRKLDGEGKVRGGIIDVPVYNQLNVPNGEGTNLCWACCDAMWISYIINDKVDRTKSVAIAVAKDMVKKGIETGDPNCAAVFNVPRPWQSTYYVADLLNADKVIDTQTQKIDILPMAEIEAIIDGGSPFAILQGGFDGDGVWGGHWTLGVGYACAEGHEDLVVTNDPWGGVQRVQTYSELRGISSWSWSNYAL